MDSRRGSHTLRDPELDAEHTLLHQLAEVTGTDVHEVYRGTLLQFRNKSNPAFGSREGRSSTWLLSRPVTKRVKEHASSVRSQRSLGGYQYCQTCLETANVKLPLFWRFSFVTVCPTHSCLLSSECPHCGRGIDFSISQKGHSGQMRTIRYICLHCRQNIGHPNSGNGTITVKDIDHLVRQQSLHLALVEQSLDGGECNISAYFLLLEWLVDLYFPKAKESVSSSKPFLLSGMAKLAGVQAFTPTHLVLRAGRAFRLEPAPTRARILLSISTILDPWPAHYNEFRRFFSDALQVPLSLCSPTLFVKFLNDPSMRGVVPYLGSSLGHHVLISRSTLLKRRQLYSERIFWTNAARNVEEELADILELHRAQAYRPSFAELCEEYVKALRAEDKEGRTYP
jgi:hypothetical protein